MLIRTGYEIVLEYPVSTPVLAMLHIHPSRATSIRRAESLVVEPKVRIEDYIDAFGNRCSRLVVPAGQIRFWNDVVVEDSGEPDPKKTSAEQHEIHELPADVLPFLLPSRYCEVDRMLDVAWQMFGAGPTGWGRVQAVCDFVHQHIRFDYLQARSTRTAYEAYQERVGVCRDFSHLAITLCRCLNIPARYCTGYLGDIGVPAKDEPMDFHAWFGAYLGGEWRTFDARYNVPRVGRILMARGRDAADVALLTSFGVSNLSQFKVWTDEVSETYDTLELTNREGQEANMTTTQTNPPKTEAATRESISDKVSMLDKALSLLQTTDLETVARHIEEQNYGLAKSELYNAAARVKHARDSIERAHSELSGAVEAWPR